MIHDRLAQLLERAGQVLRVLRRVRELERAAGGADLIDRGGESESKVNVTNNLKRSMRASCSNAQAGQPRLVQDRPDFGVNFLRHAARLQVMTDNGIETRFGRQRVGRYLETFGQFIGEIPIERDLVSGLSTRSNSSPIMGRPYRPRQIQAGHRERFDTAVQHRLCPDIEARAMVKTLAELSRRAM